MLEYSIIITYVISKPLNGKTKLSQVRLLSIDLNTNFTSLNEIALPAMNHVQKDVGALGLKTVKSSVKSVVVHNAMEEGALGQNLENAAISFVLEDVLGQSNQIVW